MCAQKKKEKGDSGKEKGGSVKDMGSSGMGWGESDNNNGDVKEIEPPKDESPDARAKREFRTDREDIYKPLIGHLKRLYKGARALDRHIPIGDVARMQVAGKFTPERHQPLYEDVREVLTTSKDYVEHYWKLEKKIAREFDNQMKKEGLHNTNAKEYVSLKAQIAEGVIFDKGKYWSLSYDTYMPKLREGARRVEGEPRNGDQMYADMVEMFEPEMKRLKSLQNKVVTQTKTLNTKVKAIKLNSPKYKQGL